ncbi:hypothetical protein PT286_08615 [Neisseriaceae bacterium ESL0693]|nr:hypothetical protein [Neisseriaceae bacterium ESL0693]
MQYTNNTTVMLDKCNRVPDLELLEVLEHDGYDVAGAKVRIYALYNIVQYLFVMCQDINKARQYLAYVDKIVEKYYSRTRAECFFAEKQKGAELEFLESIFL